MKTLPALLLTALLLPACSHHHPPKALEPSPSAPSAGIQQSAYEEPAARDELAGIDPKTTYSLTVKNADLKDSLLLLSRKIGRPIIADADVNARVTADLQNRPAREILTILLKPFGYTAYAEDGIIRVGRPRMITKTFYVNYLKDKRESRTSTNASESQSGTNSSGAYQSQSGTGNDKGVTVKTSGTSDFWSEIIKGLEVMVFGEAGGSTKTEGGYSKGDKSGKQLVVNELAGLVYIRDYPDDIRNVGSFLDDVDRSLKRQVLIEAQIAEVSLSDNFQLGINWSTILNGGYLGSDLSPMSVSQNLVPAVPTNVFQIGVSNSKVTALLDAMKEQGSLNMLSSPKVATLNNQKAVIKLITKEVSWYTKTTVTGNPPVTFSDNEPQIDEVGVYLDVTPQIDEQGTISMQVHPSVSAISSTSVSPDGKSSKPVIDIREVDSMVQVRNNQTIVIAGLIVDKVTETKKSVPLLGDIPWLGALFSFTSHSKAKTELVILITPIVLDNRTIEEIRKEHEGRLLKNGRTLSSRK